MENFGKNSIFEVILVEKLRTKDTTERINGFCLILAIKAEGLCKAGNWKDGLVYFKLALKAGTEDIRALSAIYTQMANAYFHLGDYFLAKQYHRIHLMLKPCLDLKKKY